MLNFCVFTFIIYGMGVVLKMLFGSKPNNRKRKR